MAKVVRQRRRLDDLGVYAANRVGELSTLLLDEFLGEPSSKLCDLEGMGQAIVEDVTFLRGHDLGNPCQSAKCRAVQDSITVPFTRVPLVDLSRLAEPPLVPSGGRRL